MMRWLFLLLSAIAPSALIGQTINWYGILNEGFFNVIEYSTRDNENNLYYSGNFVGTADLDPNPNTTNIVDPVGVRNPFVGKLNSNYELEWVKNLDSDHGRIFDILPTIDGGLILSLFSFEYVDLDPGEDTYLVDNSLVSGTNVVCKWDAVQKPEWYWEIFKSGIIIPTAVFKHPNEGYLIIGSTRNGKITGIRNLSDTILFPDVGVGYIFLIHIADDGKFLHYATIGGSSTGGSLDIMPDAWYSSIKENIVVPASVDSLIYIASYMYGSPSILFENGTTATFSPTKSGLSRAFVASLSFDGKVHSFRQIESSHIIIPRRIQSDGYGGNYFLGHFNDTLFIPLGVDTIHFNSNKKMHPLP